MAPQTAETMHQNFKTIYPEIMPSLSSLRFLEQYDPTDESVESKSQPYAYVCDVVHEVKLGIEFDEVRGRGVNNDAWTAMMDLRDKLAPGEKVSWFVVVCGDLERWAPQESNGVNKLNGTNGLHVNGHSKGHAASSTGRGSWGKEESEVCVSRIWWQEYEADTKYRRADRVRQEASRRSLEAVRYESPKGSSLPLEQAREDTNRIPA
jgi:hypothetical protein